MDCATAIASRQVVVDRLEHDALSSLQRGDIVCSTALSSNRRTFCLGPIASERVFSECALHKALHRSETDIQHLLIAANSVRL